MERNSLSNNSMKEYHRRTNGSSRSTRSSDSNNNTMMMIKDNNIDPKFADHSSWKVNNYEESEEEYGFSWPPRSYTCSFCKREFRSAQALGGHMNVHRKDRARLRQSPPRDHGVYGTTTSSTIFNLNLNLNPNPNPNFSPSSFSSVSTRLPPLIPYSSLSSNLASPTLSSLSYSPYSFGTYPNEDKKWLWSNTSMEYHTEVVLDQNDLIMSTKGSDLAKKNIKDKQSVYGVGENQCFADKDKLKNLKKAESANNVRLDLEIGLLGDPKTGSQDLDLELRLGYS